MAACGAFEGFEVGGRWVMVGCVVGMALLNRSHPLDSIATSATRSRNNCSLAPLYTVLEHQYDGKPSLRPNSLPLGLSQHTGFFFDSCFRLSLYLSSLAPCDLLLLCSMAVPVSTLEQNGLAVFPGFLLSVPLRPK